MRSKVKERIKIYFWDEGSGLCSLDVSMNNLFIFLYDAEACIPFLEYECTEWR